jgi:hypothetical protein
VVHSGTIVSVYGISTVSGEGTGTVGVNVSVLVSRIVSSTPEII